MSCETVIEAGKPLPPADGVNLAVYAHGAVLSTRQEGYFETLTLPDNVRLVFFYNPRKMDTCAAININGVSNTIKTNGLKRYLFKEGCTYSSFPKLVYSFNDPEDPHAMGVRREDGSIITTEQFDRSKFYPLLEIVNRLSTSYSGQGVITLYFFSCGAREDSRMTDTIGLYAGKRRTRRRHKKRHTRRQRYRK